MILLIGLYYSHQLNISLYYLTGDYATVLKAPFYAGLISNIGIIFWFITGSVCVFAYFAGRTFHPEKTKGFIVYGAAISLMLGMDDLILFHEKTRYLFNVNEAFLFLVYGMIVFVFLIRYQSTFLDSPQVSLFVLSLSFFALSILMDKNILGLDREKNLYHLLEDGAKFVGIICWSVFFINYSYSSLSDRNL
jgi:hypothetical protein